MLCSKNSGRIKFIKGESPDRRYIGVCDDCDFKTEPESLVGAVAEMDVHYKIQPNFVAPPSKKGFRR